MTEKPAPPSLQKLADAADLADPRFEHIARHILGIRPALSPRVWEYVMAYRALEQTDMLRDGRRGIAFGSGREPLTYAVPMRAGFLCATDLYTGSTAWDTARTEDAREFVLAEAPNGFDASRIEVRSMDMCGVDYPDHSFDFAYSISTLEHIGFDADFVQHLREVRRVLKPGGVYVLTTEMRIGGPSFRVRTNHCFDFDHLLSLFREAGLWMEPYFDARLADRAENEGRELLDTRFHDASNGVTDLFMVREFGGITSVPGLFLLRAGPWNDVTLVGLEETAGWLHSKLVHRINISYSDWSALNPYGLLIGAYSPYVDLWRDRLPANHDMLFATAYRNFGSGEMEVRVTFVTSPETLSRGAVVVCINSWSLDDATDISPVVFEPVAIEAEDLVAKRFLLRFDAVADRCYSVFATKVVGEICLSDVVVVARRARGEATAATVQRQQQPVELPPVSPVELPPVSSDTVWRRLVAKATCRWFSAAAQ